MRVYEVVDLATSDAPPLRTDVEAIIVAGRRRRRRRRMATGAAATTVMAGLAVTAVIAIVVPIGRSRPPAPVPEAAAPAPVTFPVPDGPFTFTIKAYDVGRYHVATPTAVSVAYQRGPVYQKGERDAVGELVVYRPGAFAVDQVRSTKRLTVAGHPALLTVSQSNHTQLVWQYTDGGWATLETFDAPQSDLVAIAAGLVPGGQVPARLPFTVGHVPGGYVPIEATERSYPGTQTGGTPTMDAYGGMLFNRPAPAATGLVAPWNYGIGRVGGFYLAAVPNNQSNYQLRPGEHRPAAPRCESQALCHWWSEDGATQIELVGDGTLPDSEYRRILQSVRLADLAHPATWPVVGTTPGK